MVPSLGLGLGLHSHLRLGLCHRLGGTTATAAAVLSGWDCICNNDDICNDDIDIMMILS